MPKLIITLFLLLITSPSYAYLGPGVVGGSAMAILGIVFAIFAVLFGLIWFPLKKFLKNKKNKKKKKNLID